MTSNNPSKLALILGAHSDIARAVADEFARDGCAIALAARNAKSLDAFAAQLKSRRQVSVSCHEFDALAYESHEAFIDNLPALPTIAVCAVGVLGDQTRAQTDVAYANLVMQSNYQGPAAILAALANRFVARGGGVLIGVASVAGLRGRASNYVYGSAKAGLIAFLSGLRNRTAAHGVRVISVLPGFVATKMTAQLKLPKALTASPEQVARIIGKAVRNRRDVVYSQTAWRWIMRLICAIPERWFKKLTL